MGLSPGPFSVWRKGKEMRIAQAIENIKGFCCGTDAFTGRAIEAATTRDQVLYGDTALELTGVVTCIWPTAEVIRRANELGANLIVSHEALFWNHGDHREPFEGLPTFEAKRELLDAWGGVVWRFHDYIHAGVPVGENGAMVDGIFYGLGRKLGWLDRHVDGTYMAYRIEACPAEDLARELVAKLGLNGVRLVGDPGARVENVVIPMHIMGKMAADNAAIVRMERGVDCYLTMECCDFTACEYVRDAAMLGQGKCMIQLGHFNGEEPGMEFAAEWLPRALGAEAAGVPVTFVPMGDTYRYIV